MFLFCEFFIVVKEPYIGSFSSSLPSANTGAGSREERGVFFRGMVVESKAVTTGTRHCTLGLGNTGLDPRVQTLYKGFFLGAIVTLRGLG